MTDRDPLIAASDDAADTLAALAVRVAPDDPADFIRDVCGSALRLTRRQARGTGTYRVQECHDGSHGFIVKDPAGHTVPNLWFTSESHAVSAASGLNRQRIDQATAA